ncbi:response regulator [Streptomyces sp. URMC 124]|uniref:response regulator n=1 Tax=Streptomyces sp. URMC 124 TaxID=3423405 RepID=UPI003F1D4C47
MEGIEDARPDVVLLDLDMLGGSGLATVRVLARRYPPLGILVTGWAWGGWDELVLAALCAGAKGFLLKDSEPTMVLDAIRLVRGGGVAFSPGVEYVLSALRARRERCGGRAPSPRSGPVSTTCSGSSSAASTTGASRAS